MLEDVRQSSFKPPDIAAWIGTLGDEQQRVEEEAWLAHLGAARFRVVRMHGTEDAYTGEFIDHFEHGTFHCVACNHAIYVSEQHKFRSTCGWASFSDSLDGALRRIPGRNVEIVCSACGGHVGHVFTLPSHPGPRHERHCANSVSLRFVPASEGAAAGGGADSRGSAQRPSSTERLTRLANEHLAEVEAIMLTGAAAEPDLVVDPLLEA